MGFGPEREAEFRNHLTLARHEIGDDRVWRYDSARCVAAASGYLRHQANRSRVVGKGVVSE